MIHSLREDDLKDAYGLCNRKLNSTATLSNDVNVIECKSCRNRRGQLDKGIDVAKLLDGHEIFRHVENNRDPKPLSSLQWCNKFLETKEQYDLLMSGEPLVIRKGFGAGFSDVMYSRRKVDTSCEKVTEQSTKVVNINFHVGLKIYFEEEAKPYTVQAYGNRYVICTRPTTYNGEKTVYYSVIDKQTNYRGTENLTFCMGYEDIQECNEALKRFESGESELSRRNQVYIRISKIKEMKKKCFVIMVSTKFGAAHPKHGKYTKFVESVRQGRKIHTVRADYINWAEKIKQVHQNKAYLSIRFWEGIPYRSPQSEIMQVHGYDAGIQKITGIAGSKEEGYFFKLKDKKEKYVKFKEIAKNDGLSVGDFSEWFKKPIFPMSIIHFTKFRY